MSAAPSRAARRRARRLRRPLTLVSVLLPLVLLVLEATSATGQSAPASASGESAPASASGQSAPASATGQSAPAAASGQSAPAAASGQSVPATTPAVERGAALEANAPASPPAREARDAASRVFVLRIQSGIFAGTSDYITQNITRAEAENTPVLILLDTPGGALDATRDIVKSFLGARVPVLVWVGPSGARAGSAGVFITMAAHVAAMAPATNIGAAHPIGMGVGAPGDDEEEEGSSATPGAERQRSKRRARDEQEVMAQKVENDTLAFMESIATARKRNVEWAISAVRDSVSVTSEKALELRVIDLLASDIDVMLSEIDGRVVETAAGPVRLHTKGAEKLEVPMSLRQRFIAFLSDPNLVYILFVVGMLGVYLELSHPGAILPAVVGGVSLLLALTGLSVLPYNATGLIFLVIAGVCFVAEAYVTSFGLLALGGAASLVIGAILLFDSGPPGPGELPGFEIAVSPYVYGTVAALALALVLPVAWMVARAHSRKVSTGPEGIVGITGRALERIDAASGRVFVRGEYWEARSQTPIEPGEEVVVLRMEGLRLDVAPRGV